jgi:hypothetical protein
MSPSSPASGSGPGHITKPIAREILRLTFFDGLQHKARYEFRLVALGVVGCRSAADRKKVFETSYAQIHEALRALVKRAIKSGDIRKDLDPIDLLRAIVGVANVSASPDWQPSARRLVDILIAGARPMK